MEAFILFLTVLNTKELCFPFLTKHFDGHQYDYTCKVGVYNKNNFKIFVKGNLLP